MPKDENSYADYVKNVLLQLDAADGCATDGITANEKTHAVIVKLRNELGYAARTAYESMTDIPVNVHGEYADAKTRKAVLDHAKLLQIYRQESIILDKLDISALAVDGTVTHRMSNAEIDRLFAAHKGELVDIVGQCFSNDVHATEIEQQRIEAQRPKPNTHSI